MSALLEIRDLVVEYDSGGYPVRPIDGLSLTADTGELVVLLGPSGCGKTSLLSAIGGILTPRSGSILVDGTAVGTLDGRALAAYRRSQVGFVFQAFNLVPSLTATENVAVPLLLAGVPRREATARAHALLERVGMREQRDRRPAKLSGGQQQRVAVARGLAADPPVLLADEPTANLDYVHAEGIISLLRDLRSDGRLIIISTHDDRLVPIADRVVHLVPEFRSDGFPPRQLEYDAGQTIFEQGSRGELVFVVDEGTVDVVHPRADGTTEPVASIQAGDYFGELGPMLGFPRSASAVARTHVRVTAMSVADFRAQFLATQQVG